MHSGRIRLPVDRMHGCSQEIERMVTSKRCPDIGRGLVPVTASWSSSLPDGYAAIGISRGPPRGRRGYRMYATLAPGAWFRKVDERTFIERYMTQLASLDAGQVLHDLARLADGNIPPCCVSKSRLPTQLGAIEAWLPDG
jgi:hypothetical protein